MSETRAPYRVKLDAAVPEKVLQEQVRMLAKLNGWLYFHPWTAIHSAAGFPDVIAIKEGKHGIVIVAAELKRVGRQLTAPQVGWHDMLLRIAKRLSRGNAVTGVEMIVRVWRPTDMDEIIATFAREV